MNKVEISGNLTRDPEVLFTDSGLCISKASIAVNYKSKAGKESTSFFDVTLFGEVAEKFGDEAKKGTLVGFNGYLKQERWVNSEGDNRSRVVIVAFDFDIIWEKD